MLRAGSRNSALKPRIWLPSMWIWMFLRPFRSLVVFLLICYFSVSAFVSDQVLKIPFKLFQNLVYSCHPFFFTTLLGIITFFQCCWPVWLLPLCLFVSFLRLGKKELFLKWDKKQPYGYCSFFSQASCLPLLKEMFSFWIKKYYGILTRITMSFRKRKLYNCLRRRIVWLVAKL